MNASHQMQRAETDYASVLNKDIVFFITHRLKTKQLLIGKSYDLERKTLI